MVDEAEVQKLERLFKAMNIIPGIDTASGSPILIRSLTQTGVGAVTVERFLMELEKRDMELDIDTMSFKKKAKKTKGKTDDTILPPPPIEQPPNLAQEPTINENHTNPDFWTEEELAKKNRKQLTKIARDLGNIDLDVDVETLRQQLAGKPKK